MRDSAINRILISRTYRPPRWTTSVQNISVSPEHHSASMSHAPGIPLIIDAYERASTQGLEEFTKFKKESILVVKGHSDFLDRVLMSFRIPFTEIRPAELSDALLRGAVAVFVDCCDKFPIPAAHQLANYVSEGGILLTTDWAVKHVLEVGFPNMVRHNGRETEELALQDVPLTWQLKRQSYPILPIDSCVKELLASDEMREKYGSGSLHVRFTHVYGMVHHLVSHLYYQRQDLQKMIVTQVLGYQCGKTKFMNPAKIAKMLASEEESPPSKTPDWTSLVNRMQWNPNTFHYHYLMSKGENRVIIGSDRISEDGKAADEKISSDPYLFPHHVLIERSPSDADYYKITARDGIVVVHHRGGYEIFSSPNEGQYFRRGVRICLTDKVQFILDPQV